MVPLLNSGVFMSETNTFVEWGCIWYIHDIRAVNKKIKYNKVKEVASDWKSGSFYVACEFEGQGANVLKMSWVQVLSHLNPNSSVIMENAVFNTGMAL